MREGESGRARLLQYDFEVNPRSSDYRPTQSSFSANSKPYKNVVSQKRRYQIEVQTIRLEHHAKARLLSLLQPVCSQSLQSDYNSKALQIVRPVKHVRNNQQPQTPLRSCQRLFVKHWITDVCEVGDSYETGAQLWTNRAIVRVRSFIHSS